MCPLVLVHHLCLLRMLRLRMDWGPRRHGARWHRLMMHARACRRRRASHCQRCNRSRDGPWLLWRHGLLLVLLCVDWRGLIEEIHDIGTLLRNSMCRRRRLCRVRMGLNLLRHQSRRLSRLLGTMNWRRFRVGMRMMLRMDRVRRHLLSLRMNLLRNH